MFSVSTNESVTTKSVITNENKGISFICKQVLFSHCVFVCLSVITNEFITNQIVLERQRNPRDSATRVVHLELDCSRALAQPKRQCHTRSALRASALTLCCEWSYPQFLNFITNIWPGVTTLAAQSERASSQCTTRVALSLGLRQRSRSIQL